MNLVDSSCWLEYFAGTPQGDKFARPIEKLDELIVPTTVLYEVFKKLATELDEDRALVAVAHMKQGAVIDLDADSALLAARVSAAYKLPFADSVIYATAIKRGAILWTQDGHFEGLEGVRYFGK